MVDESLTPLVPASQVPPQFRPRITIPRGAWEPLTEHGARRAEGSNGDHQNHKIGIYGEYGVARYLGQENKIDTEIYPDGGDGGIDLEYEEMALQVKTASRNQSDPSLIVDASTSLPAEYYILINRIGTTEFELVGYCSRHCVANAEMHTYDGKRVYVVPQDDLFPFPLWHRGLSVQYTYQN